MHAWVYMYECVCLCVCVHQESKAVCLFWTCWVSKRNHQCHVIWSTRKLRDHQYYEIPRIPQHRERGQKLQGFLGTEKVPNNNDCRTTGRRHGKEGLRREEPNSMLCVCLLLSSVHWLSKRHEWTLLLCLPQSWFYHSSLDSSRKAFGHSEMGALREPVFSTHSQVSRDWSPDNHTALPHPHGPPFIQPTLCT